MGVPDKSGVVYVKKWSKQKHGLIFCLSNQLVQVFFKDKSELFIDALQKCVTFINPQGECLQLLNNEASTSKDEGLIKRLRYTREILNNKHTDLDPLCTTPTVRSRQARRDSQSPDLLIRT